MPGTAQRNISSALSPNVKRLIFTPQSVFRASKSGQYKYSSVLRVGKSTDSNMRAASSRSALNTDADLAAICSPTSLYKSINCFVIL